MSNTFTYNPQSKHTYGITVDNQFTVLQKVTHTKAELIQKKDNFENKIVEYESTIQKRFVYNIISKIIFALSLTTFIATFATQSLSTVFYIILLSSIVTSYMLMSITDKKNNPEKPVL